MQIHQQGRLNMVNQKDIQYCLGLYRECVEDSDDEGAFEALQELRLLRQRERDE